MKTSLKEISLYDLAYSNRAKIVVCIYHIIVLICNSYCLHHLLDIEEQGKYKSTEYSNIIDFFINNIIITDVLTLIVTIAILALKESMQFKAAMYFQMGKHIYSIITMVYDKISSISMFGLMDLVDTDVITRSCALFMYVMPLTLIIFCIVAAILMLSCGLLERIYSEVCGWAKTYKIQYVEYKPRNPDEEDV